MVIWVTDIACVCRVLQYLAQRKKQESEEKRVKQKIAREKFLAMLEVQPLCSGYLCFTIAGCGNEAKCGGNLAANICFGL
jgi:hypothetical protein